MTAAEFDLDAYFKRIGYGGSATPALDTLQALHELHPQAIPFENLDPLMHWPVRLDMASLQRKLVIERRGGYCYEHNLLLKQALEQIGFRVTALGARVLLDRSEDTITARTHMLLQVHVDDESWIADVGFGGMTLTAPLRLVENVAQDTPHEQFRLLRKGGDYVLQATIRHAWRTLYRFDLQPQYLPDYELWSWYLSNHPESHFVTQLIAARMEPARRYALSNGQLSIHPLHGETLKRKVSSATELAHVLEETFAIALPQVPGLMGRLELAVDG